MHTTSQPLSHQWEGWFVASMLFMRPIHIQVPIHSTHGQIPLHYLLAGQFLSPPAPLSTTRHPMMGLTYRYFCHLHLTFLTVF